MSDEGLAESSNEEDDNSDAEELTDSQLVKRVKSLMKRVDLSKTGLKQFVELLSEDVGTDLKNRKSFIKDCLMEALEEKEAAKNQKKAKKRKMEASDPDDSEVEESTKPKKKGSSSSRGGLAAKKQMSPALSQFLGKGEYLARTEIVKLLWEYIRDHDLQNPQNKKEILLDEPMQKVFGCQTFTMFTMNKYISAHVHPFKPVDLNSAAASSSSSFEKSKQQKPKKSRSSKDNPAKKKRKVGTQPPYRLSEELVAVVGKNALPRPQVVSKIWDYIKSNNLQNPNDKRQIFCDDALKRVMGGQATVTMFNMNQYITQHMLEKVEKSSIPNEHDEDNDDDDDEE